MMDADKLREAAETLADMTKCIPLNDRSMAAVTTMYTIASKLASGEWVMVPRKMTDAMVLAPVHAIWSPDWDKIIAAAPDPLEEA
jgi:hypothetical protein